MASAGLLAGQLPAQVPWPERKAIALAFARYMCSQNLAQSHPFVVQAVTEGRAADPRYDWCTDWVTYYLSNLLAFNDPAAIDRASTRGSYDTRVCQSDLWAFASQRGATLGVAATLAHLMQADCVGDIIFFARPRGTHIAIIGGPAFLTPLRFWTLDGNGSYRLLRWTARALGGNYSQPRINPNDRVVGSIVVDKLVGRFSQYLRVQLPRMSSIANAWTDATSSGLLSRGRDLAGFPVWRPERELGLDLLDQTNGNIVDAYAVEPDAVLNTQQSEYLRNGT